MTQVYIKEILYMHFIEYTEFEQNKKRLLCDFF